MIKLLSARYPKHIAYVFFLLFLSGLLPARARYLPAGRERAKWFAEPLRRNNENRPARTGNVKKVFASKEKSGYGAGKATDYTSKEFKPANGGPTQPEMQSFKPVGANDMVNLFTGDFSYNIPLLDVGGYPVNIFYDGNVTPEQEASWVGLGWNINPGSVTRNMRGVPDDFDGTGTDKLVQRQNMKPNVTWGGRLGWDLEFSGIKNLAAAVSLGMSVNNYLGPAVELGVKGGLNFQVANSSASEKNFNIGGGISANLSSRNGLTLSPNFSFSANGFAKDRSLSFGARLSTDYNSRSGIKQLQLSEQMAYNVRSQIPIVSRYANSLSNLTFSTPITFSKPSYLPALRLPVTNTTWSGNFQFGGGLSGLFGSDETEVYKQVAEIAANDIVQTKPLIGYLYSQNARADQSAVMDFTRFNDNEVTPNTPVISAPQYAYDVFSIQGEGTGGTVRAYRNDFGYVRDNYTQSKEKSLGFGVDVGPPGHYGGNFNMVKTPSTVGEWGNGNGLKTLKGFGGPNGTIENVYFRNPGENSVIDPAALNAIGGLDLVRFKLGGTDRNPILQPDLEVFPKDGAAPTTMHYAGSGVSARNKRTQVTSFLTAREASEVGLDKKLKSYSPAAVLGASNNLLFDEFPRFDNNDHQDHHLSQITVTEGDGKRYVYGIPVYNHLQKDFTFTVTNKGNEADLVKVNPAEVLKINSNGYNNDPGKDGYLQVTTTPPYAHSFLLSGLLSPDYVDVTDDGITDDDLGQAVKFNYTRLMQGANPLYHKWQTPAAAGTDLQAHFNDGHLSEVRDDKGLITYGEREAWYLHSVESKTMIALFTLENREDGKGVTEEMGITNGDDQSQKRLKKIDLYSKADLKKNGIAGARPVKTVWFTYNYSLCKNAPGNSGKPEPGETSDVNAAKGKLTLRSIYFTYNGKSRLNKNRYLFSYTKDNNVTENNHDAEGNPDYQPAAADRWGTYKPGSQNPEGTGGKLKNSVYPYSVQDAGQANQNAGAWSLKRILLPSGGQLEVDYESDDYAYVQNKQATAMMNVLGLGSSPAAAASNKLYSVGSLGIADNLYVRIKVPEPCATNAEVKEKYLKGIEQLAFKIAVKMPKGTYEYVPVYAAVAAGGEGISYGVTGTADQIWLKLNTVSGLSPLTLGALDYLREQLPGQAFPGYDVSAETGIEQAGHMLSGMLDAVSGAFSDPVKHLRSRGLAQSLDLGASFVRLNVPYGRKFGGGNRVHQVRLKDNWNAMTQQYTAAYGQVYSYTTTEVFAGKERIISSGVASYEPSIGGEENPFHTIVQVENKLPMGPTSYGAVEMPVLDAFFPAPVVGYSKITVQSLRKNTPFTQNRKSRSGVGKQVTEFYTARDFPVYYSQTVLDPTADKTEHKASLFNFFYKYAFDSRALSQGFLVVTNDMHGKMKSQSSYAEGDEKTRVNYTENFYRNTGAKGLDEKFDFVYAAEGGNVRPGNMGIDVELMTDTREFSTKSQSLEIQGQMDWLVVFPPIWLPFIWPVAGNSENTYRAVTTTKVVNYHSVVDRVVAIDKGSEVSTQNLLYDAETGAVVVNRTNNEFNKPVYTTTYPAWWAYSGMGLAYKNIDAAFTGVDFLDGKAVNNAALLAASESGDELYIAKPGANPSGCGSQIASPDDVRKIWAFNKNKNTTSLTDPTPDFIFLDAKGKPYTKSNVNVRIIRSGHRNLLGQTVSGITTMSDPVDKSVANDFKLIIHPDAKVVTASAVAFQEKWKTDEGVINRLRQVPVQSQNLIVNADFSAGNSGFTSDYTEWTGTHTGGHEGSYTVAAASHQWNTDFWDCHDHTTGSGLMLMVNGAGSSATKFWKQTVSVTPNTDYLFSFWAAPLILDPGINNAMPHVWINNASAAPSQKVSHDQCMWSYCTVQWNSGSSTTAAISMGDDVTAATDNDFAVDDLSFRIDDCVAPLQEELFCGGYLETSINPYVKGLLGNFQPFRSLVVYTDRVASESNFKTNLPKDGFLAAFQPYWYFVANDRLVYDNGNTNGKWTWTTQITRLNARGNEIENKNALGIYSSTIFGFEKSMPVASTANARVTETDCLNFEDNDYNARLQGSAQPPCQANNGFTNSQVIRGRGHSGSGVLSVTGGMTAQKLVPIRSQDEVSFELGTQTVTTGSLINPGGVLEQKGLSLSPAMPGSSAPTVLTTNAFNPGGKFGLEFHVNRSSQPSSVWESYAYHGTQYIEIKRNGTYTFRSEMSQTGDRPFYTPNIILVITDVATGQTIGTGQSFVETYYGGRRRAEKACLRKGIYKVVCQMGNSISPYCANGALCSANPSPSHFYDSYYLSIDGFTDLGYADDSKTTTCVFTKPVPGTETMINAGFSLSQNKRMLFSAWVREDCGAAAGTPCNSTGYNNTEVRLEFNDAGYTAFSLKPVGPVIEGWQRCEGTFTAPAGSTQMTMKLINNGSQPLYLDDVRIHPFNANMKSYVYDPVTLRLVAQLDENNYATFYEYDEEGTLVRTKIETRQGVKTVNETRSFKQTSITDFQ